MSKGTTRRRVEPWVGSVRGGAMAGAVSAEEAAERRRRQTRTAAGGAGALMMALGLVFATVAPDTHAQIPELVAPAAEGAEDAGKTELRQRQATLFSALREDPDNLDLMFAYAEVSARAEDFEAAISTLERMLIYEPSLARVRLELGALYFKIGSYAASERYFRSVLAEGDPPPAVRARVDSFLAEIDDRTARHRFAGSVSAGVVFSTNANLGPGSEDVLFAGLDAQLDNEFVEQEDFGVRGTARIAHSYDLGTARDDSWRTELSAFGLRYETTTEGEVAAVTVRTGPRISADPERFGLKIRPFVEGSYLDVGRDPLYWAYGGGVEAGKTLGDKWFAFGEAKATYRDYFSPRQDNDGMVYRSAAGVAFAPRRDLSFRLIGHVEREEAIAGEERSWEGGARLAVSYDYEPGLRFVDRKWNLSGFTRLARRQFDDADPVVDPDRRRTDTDYAVGLAHTFHIQNGFAVVVDADYLFRDSNIVNFELDSFNSAVSFSYNF